jgi:hypothetical protein
MGSVAVKQLRRYTPPQLIHRHSLTRSISLAAPPLSIACREGEERPDRGKLLGNRVNAISWLRRESYALTRAPILPRGLVELAACATVGCCGGLSPKSLDDGGGLRERIFFGRCRCFRRKL